MSDELTDIDGVAEAMAERLVDAGFESVTDITAGTTEALTAVEGVGPSRAESLMQSAFREHEAEHTETSADTPGFEVPFQCSSELYPHVVGAVADELRDAEQTNDPSRRAHARGVFDRLIDSDPTGEIVLVLEMEELVAFRRGVKHRARRYRRSGTMPNLGPALVTLSEHLQDIRNEHWGE